MGKLKDLETKVNEIIGAFQHDPWSIGANDVRTLIAYITVLKATNAVLEDEVDAE